MGRIKTGMVPEPVWSVDEVIKTKRREPPMSSCLVLESIIQDPVYKGGNHHEDPMILFSLTSSRLDSIRASQRLVFIFVIGIFAKEH
jgi:hypothetical protein